MVKMTLTSHLDELRRRLLKSLIAVALTTGFALLFTKKIFHWFGLPMLKALGEGGTFIATGPTEGLFTYLKVALLAGCLIGSPVLFFQLWRFIAPGLKTRELKLALPFSILSALLFIGGAFFGYFVVFPVGFKYFVAIFAGTDIRFMPQMKDYLSFASRLLLAFGLVFELPLLMTFLAYAGIVDAGRFRKARRYVVVGVFVVAAVLTPGPDVLSQILMAVPLLILYELGIILARIFKKREEI